MILTATKMKRVVHRVAAQSAPFQRKTTLSVLHHRVLFLSLSLSLLLLFYSLALNRNNNNQPRKERRKQQSEERGMRGAPRVFRVSYKP